MSENDAITPDKLLLYSLLTAGVIIVISLVLSYKLNGRSLGQLLLGMKYVTLGTAAEIDGNDYIDLILHHWINSIKHTEIYSVGYFLSSKLNQTVAMEKEGIIIVNSRKHRAYQRFIKTSI